MVDLTLDEVMMFLSSVEERNITLTSKSQPQEVYAGNVHYTASNGWAVVVFNDCNDWDYLDEVIAEDGRSWHWDGADPPSLYKPSEKVSWEAYGIPGYMTCRDPWPNAPTEGEPKP